APGAEPGPCGALALPLGAVPRAGLLAVAHAGGVEGAADDLVANAGEVADAPAAHEDDGVLLQVVTHTGDVGRHLLATRQTHARHLAQGGVRLLRRVRVDARADPTPLGRAPERRGLGLGRLRLPALADQLRDRGHCEIRPYPAVSSGPAKKLASSSPMLAAASASPAPVPMLA